MVLVVLLYSISVTCPGLLVLESSHAFTFGRSQRVTSESSSLCKTSTSTMYKLLNPTQFYKVNTESCISSMNHENNILTKVPPSLPLPHRNAEISWHWTQRRVAGQIVTCTRQSMVIAAAAMKLRSELIMKSASIASCRVKHVPLAKKMPTSNSNHLASLGLVCTYVFCWRLYVLVLFTLRVPAFSSHQTL